MNINLQQSPSSNTHVPDKVYSFTLQIRHMLYELISLDSKSIVSTEAYDDVAVDTGSSITAIQIKSTQSKNNPIADRAKDLWKTLFNWFQYVKDGMLDLSSTKFLLMVVASHPITYGKISQSFIKANDIESAKAALIQAKNELWGVWQEKRDKVPKVYKDYIEVLFNSYNQSVVAAIIMRMDICVKVETYDDELFDKFSNQTIPIECLEDTFIYMLGWVQEKVNEQIKVGKPAFIKCSEYRNELIAQVRRYSQDTILAAYSTEPSQEQQESEIKKQNVYIKQLGLINADYSEKIQAVNDYLRSCYEKTKWAEKGIVVKQSLTDYAEDLKRKWNITKKLHGLNIPFNDEKAGYHLFLECMGYKANLQGKEVPSFFTSGCFHTLANELIIGWHPNYNILLKGEVKDDIQD